MDIEKIKENHRKQFRARANLVREYIKINKKFPNEKIHKQALIINELELRYLQALINVK